MAYNPELADRIRAAIIAEPDYADLLSEKKMFGGLAFLIAGTMAVTASSAGGMMLRVDPATEAHLVNGRDIVPMEMRGRPMAGWLHLAPEALESDADLGHYVRLGLAYAKGMPPGR